MCVHFVVRQVHARERELRGDETCTITFDHTRNLVRAACVHCKIIKSAYSVAHFRQDVGYARVLLKDGGPLAL